MSHRHITTWHELTTKSGEFTFSFQENSQDQEQLIFDEDHKCIILDVGRYMLYSYCIVVMLFILPPSFIIIPVQNISQS